jgi:hypothetical protein
MNRLVRFLLMFGPMIFRQYQKYQSKKQREEMSRSRLPQQGQSSRRNTQQQQQYGNEPQDGRYYKSPNSPQQSRKRAPEPKKAAPISEDEKNFKMKEEEFMLDPQTESEYQKEMQDIADIERSTNTDLSNTNTSNDYESSADSDKTLDRNNPIERADEDSGFSIRDLFIKPEDDEDQDA